MNRPKIIINCASSLDGKIASSEGEQVRISSEEDMKRMYELRNECDAVLIGINTVLSDDPKLTVKEKYVNNPHQPIRIVLDSHCRTPVDSKVVNKKAKTLLVVNENEECNKKYPSTVEIVFCKQSQDKMIDLKDLMEKLYEKDIEKVMVEGGGTIIWNFIKQGLVDELFVYIGSMIIGGKHTPTMAMGEGFENEKEFKRLQLINTQRLGEGILLHYHYK